MHTVCEHALSMSVTVLSIFHIISEIHSTVNTEKQIECDALLAGHT